MYIYIVYILFLEAVQEIHPDDLECGDCDDLLDAVADAAGEEEDGLDEMPVEGSRDFICELFSFTRPVALYKRLFEQPFLLKVESFVVMTSTAHPAVWLAARTGVQWPSGRADCALLENSKHFMALQLLRRDHYVGSGCVINVLLFVWCSSASIQDQKHCDEHT